MDETGFRINYKIVYCVIILNKSKQFRFVNSDNRDYITSIKVINVEN